MFPQSHESCISTSQGSVGVEGASRGSVAHCKRHQNRHTHPNKRQKLHHLTPVCGLEVPGAQRKRVCGVGSDGRDGGLEVGRVCAHAEEIHLQVLEELGDMCHGLAVAFLVHMQYRSNERKCRL